MIQLKATKAGTCFNLMRVVADVWPIRDGLDKALTPTHGLAAGSLAVSDNSKSLRYRAPLSNPLPQAAYFSRRGA